MVSRGGSRKFTLVGLWNRGRSRAEICWGYAPFHVHVTRTVIPYLGVTLTTKQRSLGSKPKNSQKIAGIVNSKLGIKLSILCALLSIL